MKTDGLSITAAFLALSFPVSAQDGEASPPCAQLEVINGMTASSDISAIRYSRSRIGEIGISVRPGADQGSTPQVIKTAIAGRGVDSECFINRTGIGEGGTVFSFYVAGLPVEYDGETTFGLNDLVSNKDILRTAVGEAILARNLLVSPRPSE